MRTTIEITREQWAELRKLASQRGKKGFSELVQEALDAYLSAQKERAKSLVRALRAAGSLSEEDVSSMRAAVRELRSGRWRSS